VFYCNAFINVRKSVYVEFTESFLQVPVDINHSDASNNNNTSKNSIKILGQVYVDSVYANKNNNNKLGKKNNKILHRAYRNKPLTKQQKQ
jgi:hypothetical protein